MRSKLFLFIAYILFISACGQQKHDADYINRYDTDYINRTKSFIADWKKGKNISEMLLVDSANVFDDYAKFAIDKVKEYNAKSAFYTFKFNNPEKKRPGQNEGFFTQSEIEYISDCVKKSHFAWTPDIAGNNVVVTTKSNVTSTLRANYSGNAWSNFPNGCWELSDPIFFRNNTMCLFYYEHHRDGYIADEGTLAIYFKSENGWVLRDNLGYWEP